MISEISDNGHQEGQYKGPYHDDIGFAGAIHFPLYLGFLHLVIETNFVDALMKKDLKLLEKYNIIGRFNV